MDGEISVINSNPKDMPSIITANIPLKWKIIILVLFFGISLIVIKVTDDHFYKGITMLEYGSQLDTVLMKTCTIGNGCTKWGTLWLHEDDSLVENFGGFSDWSKIRKVAPDLHCVRDVPCPYYMYKKANNDTLVIIKDEYVLKFLLKERH